MNNMKNYGKLKKLKEVPVSHRRDLQEAITILKEEGCGEIYLFGSLVNGDHSEKSDIDLAVRGLQKRKYFRALGRLMLKLDHHVDLVNLEKRDRFSTLLLEKRELVRVA